MRISLHYANRYGARPVVCNAVAHSQGSRREHMRSAMTNETQEGDRNHSPIRTPGERIRTVTGKSFHRLVLEDRGPVVVEFSNRSQNW